MKQDATEVIESKATAEIEQVQVAASVQDDDFLSGVQAADAESFNVCISCD